MNVIIMGCGRVGAQLARLMVEEGHQVTVIDYEPDALARLGPGFKGRTVIGVGFDRNVLVEAGIERADVFAATSSSDNANIVAARIARQIFRVPRVVARLFEPRRAEIYRRLGLMTISSTDLGAERIRELILHADLEPAMTFGNGEVCVVHIETPPQLVGRMVRNLVIPGEITVVAITRQNRAFIPISGTEFQSGDLIHMVVLSTAMERFKSMLGLSEGG